MGRHRAPDGTGPERQKRLGHVLLIGALCSLMAVTALWLTWPNGGDADAGVDRVGAQGSAATTDPGRPPATTLWQPTSPDPASPPPQTPDAAETSAVRLSIPSIGVDSVLVPLGVDPGTGTLQPPQAYNIAGVFAAGPVPGQIGPAVIAGHIDSGNGPGVFYRLQELAPEDRVSVFLSDGQEVVFRVVSVAQYPKDAFPTDLVYGTTPERALRLITCGGSFDRSRQSYLDNIVVYAVRI